jgi:polysaccharide chain length determinant protein (PEP-CTERM system associated)
MKKTRFHGTRDYLAVLVRRKWWALSISILAAGLAVLFALIVPDVFVSESMILIKPREVPSDFVKDLISGTTDERLTAIQQTILSRTNLLKIINEFEASLVQLRGLNDEVKVEQLKKRITIDYPSEKLRGTYQPITTITIAFRDRNPDLAQKIDSRLGQLFIEQDSRAREEQVFGTTEFFKTELNKVGDELKQSEAQLQQLKGRYRYELPNQFETNLRTLDRLQLEKNGNIEALDRYVSMQLVLEQQLSETSRTIPREQANRSQAPGAPPTANQAWEIFRKKQQDYQALVGSKKENHPDALRLKAELDKMEKALPPLPLTPLGDTTGDTAQDMVPNPVYQNLSGQLQQIKTEMEIRQNEKKWIDGQITLYLDRVQKTPQIEQETQALIRTTDDLNKQHEDLKGKLAQAMLSESLESRQKGSQFILLDPANYPLEPAPPQRPIILLVGLGISVAVGLAGAFVIDFLSPSIFTEGELERALESNVLIEIPSITTLSDTTRARHRAIAFAAAFVVLLCVYGGCLYFLYHKQAFLLRILDPVIQRIHS